MTNELTDDYETTFTGEQWHIVLLGGLRAERGNECLDRFRSQKYGALLAYLALYGQRTHSREELADLFWPDSDPEVARTNIRSALASLRRQLEPPGTNAGSVLVSAGRHHIGLNRASLHTDVQQFEAALKAAFRTSTAPGEKKRRLEEAANLYTGPLLPGLYETWVLTERDRLVASNLRVLRELSALHEAEGNFDQALDYARREVSADPLREEAHADVIRLLMRTEQTAAAQRHYNEMAQLLEEQLGAKPASQTRALLHASSAPLTAPRLAGPTLEAIQTSQATGTPLPSSAPAPVPAASPVRLPLTVTRFFGREEEIESLGALLQRPQTRLISLTGPGGAGKTRLSVEVARKHAAAFPGGVSWVSLAEVTDPERIAERIASALSLELTPSAPVLTQITNALSALSAPCLLLLDNAEHLTDAMAPVVHQLLATVSLLTCLVTSRQRLLLEAEHEFPLLPFATPRHPGLPDRLMEFASVQLFVSRAQAARADFQLSTHNADTVAALCTRLEGLPLAIELAAAWSRTLTPAQMLERMDRRFELLVSRRRDLSPRHRSLRATVEASVELLSPLVQQFFYRLSVFRGGWTLDAAESVTEEPGAAEYLEELQERSLIFTLPLTEEESSDASPLRFQMLETLREFAAEQIDDAERMRLASHHAAFFADLIEQSSSEIFKANQAVWLRRLGRDKDNLRAMLAIYDSPEGANTALRLIGQMWRFWMADGGISEGRRYFDQALARADESVSRPFHARALYGASLLAKMQADYPAARQLAEQSLDLWQAEGNQARATDVLGQLASIEKNQGNYAKACDYHQQVVTFQRASSDPTGLPVVLNNFSACLLEWGKHDKAVALLEECLPLARANGMQHIEACALANLGTIRHEQKDFAAARPLYERSADMRRQMGDKHSLAYSLESLGTLDLDEGQTEAGLRWLDECLTLRREMQDAAGLSDVQTFRGRALLQQCDLAKARVALEEALTLAYRIDSQWRVARGLEAFAQSAVEKSPERAARLRGAAARLRDTIEISVWPDEVQALEAVLIRAREKLGTEKFASAWAAGQALPTQAAVDLALSTNG